jgi:DNA-binding NarL/FixJ family response regulator
VRVVIADDAALMREGLARLLSDAGCEIAATTADAVALRRAVRSLQPDAAIIDIRMPPTHTDEGLVAAQQLHVELPSLGILVLSNYLEPRYALRLLGEHPGGLGYLLKERVSDVAVLSDALHRLVAGECVIDPTIVAGLMAARRRHDPLDALTPREREVLAVMAEGRSNGAIGDQLFLSPKTVETHVRAIFGKLGLRDSPSDHRRVLAVLHALRGERPSLDTGTVAPGGI